MCYSTIPGVVQEHVFDQHIQQIYDSETALQDLWKHIQWNDTLYTRRPCRYTNVVIGTNKSVLFVEVFNSGQCPDKSYWTVLYYILESVYVYIPLCCCVRIVCWRFETLVRFTSLLCAFLDLLKVSNLVHQIKNY